MQLFSTTFPLFCFLIGGFLAKRCFKLSNAVSEGFNKLTYYVGMPAMIFRGIATFDFADTFRPDMVLHNLTVTGILFILVFGLSFLIRRKQTRGAFHLSAFRSNIGYIGLPVVQGFYGEEAMSRAAVINGFDSPYCVFLSIFSLSVFRMLQSEEKNGESGRKLLAKKLLSFLYNPFLIATVLGLLASYFGFDAMKVPVFSDLVEMCASLALPLALISIGFSISLPAVRHNLGALSAVCAIRLILAPTLGYLLGRFVFGFTGSELAFTSLLCGTPVSVSSFVLASEMDADSEFSASAIGISTLLSLFTLTILQFGLSAIT